MAKHEQISSTHRFSITISRQMGSLGCEIARKTADLLGYRTVWQDLINQAAIRAGAPEVALATIDEFGLLGVSPSPRARKAYQQAVRQVMEELAASGNVVIVGRAGQAILAGRTDVLHVRVIAPPSLRAERIAQRKGIPLDGAQAQVEASDRYRQHYLRRFYHVRWDNPELYDLVINTGRVSPAAAADLIRQALVHRQNQFNNPPLEQENSLESL